MGKITYQSSDGRMLKRAGTAFDVYKQELKAGQDVLVKIAAPPKADGSEYDPSLWWYSDQPTATDRLILIRGRHCSGDAIWRRASVSMATRFGPSIGQCIP